MFWVWIFGQAHLQVIAMKSDEMKSLNLKIAEFLLNSDSLAQILNRVNALRTPYVGCTPVEYNSVGPPLFW